MFKRLILALLFMPGMASGQSHEILRPVSDADDATGSGACGDTRLSSSSMSNSYDAAGTSTSSQLTVNGTSSATRWKNRTFSSWASSATGSYTALTLNVNTSSPGASIIGGGPTNIGIADVSYSLNSGATYTSMENNSAAWPQRTATIALSPGQDLSKLRVNACVEADANTFGTVTDTIVVYDIWTDGTYTPTGMSGGSGSGNGNSALAPVIVSMAGDIDDRVLRAVSSFPMPVDIRDIAT